MVLQSDPGDYIGAGLSYTYTPATAVLGVSASAARLSVRITGDQTWSGEFQAMNSLAQLQPGYYSGLQRYPTHDPAVGGLSWFGQGRGCNTVQGWFVVDAVTYAGSQLASIDLRFEQRCEGRTQALRGRIHWSADDSTAAPAPVYPPPAGLWKPSADDTPDEGNFVYLQSDPGDYIGAARSLLYTPATAVLAVSTNGGYFSVRVDGDENWLGDFQAMNSLGQLQPGYYGDLRRYPFHNPVKGGLSWAGEGRGCNTLQGWFVVDSISYQGGKLQEIDLRFEQHCEGGAPALRGRVRWSVDDDTMPPGPVNPPPAGLWQPAEGSTPQTGNFVYLQSDPGDYVGQGLARTYTQATALLSVSVSGGRLAVTVNGNQQWWGSFQAMNTLSLLQPGYYGDLQRDPFHNPVKGGLDWSGDGRGCNMLRGWFVVDDIVYAAGVLKAIDLRFEQHCEGGTPALHGRIRWSADDTTTPPGPVNPPPAGLWQPAEGAVPASGNYVYLQSDPGDYIGQGLTRIYTPATTTFSVTGSAGRLRVYLNGAQYWSGDFQAMNSLALLQPGYYGDLQRYPFHNPVKGGMNWSGNSRGCNTLRGWFVVDRVTYTAGALSAIDLRFEQHCEGGTPALRGQVHWVAGA